MFCVSGDMCLLLISLKIVTWLVLIILGFSFRDFTSKVFSSTNLIHLPTYSFTYLGIQIYFFSDHSLELPSGDVMLEMGSGISNWLYNCYETCRTNSTERLVHGCFIKRSENLKIKSKFLRLQISPK